MIKLAIVGVGKIVRDQHLPSINTTGLFDLCATASRNAKVDGVASYSDITTLLSEHADIEAIALCMPPQFRFEAACIAIDRGCHVLLEKPPGATVSEVNHLHQRAQSKGVSLYATWHSRHAPAVVACAELLTKTRISEASLTWVEDVRKWHPGQDWIWQAGGLGVFDPGINGLSILSEVVGDDLFVRNANLEIPLNKQAPIAAQLTIQGASGFNVDVEMDWRVPPDSQSRERWEMRFQTELGEIALIEGGSQCLLKGEPVNGSIGEHSPYVEYEAIYREFALLIQAQQSLVDTRPLQLVADSFLLGQVSRTEAFEE